LVGPDNGLLSLAWEAAGGLRSAVQIHEPTDLDHPIAESFRAPDTLCPAAAHLAAGLALDQLGNEIDLGTLAVVTVPEPEIQDGKIRCEVIDLNRFVTVQMNVRPRDFHAHGLTHR